MAAALTILGSSPAWTNPGGAGSGYLLRSGATSIQIEAGSGTFGRLRRFLSVDQLSAVVISHMHGDHFLDLVPLCYGIQYGNLRPSERLLVLVPPGCIEFLSNFGRALNGEPEFFSKAFDLREYTADADVTVNELTFRPTWVQHYIPSYALRFDIGRGFVFSGDSGPCDELVAASAQADALLCEAALTDTRHDAPDPKHRGHLTPGEAAQVAERAGVRRLMLTHFRTDIQTHEAVEAEARPHFAGRLTLVREQRTYKLD